jgi:hypothetical protein
MKESICRGDQLPVLTGVQTHIFAGRLRRVRLVEETPVAEDLGSGRLLKVLQDRLEVESAVGGLIGHRMPGKSDEEILVVTDKGRGWASSLCAFVR